jgi:ATP-binding protein involved in chromosome partitioning
MPTKEEILAKLKTVRYPGFSKDIVALGAVESVETDGGAITVTLKKISAEPDVIERLREDIKSAVTKVSGVSGVNVLLGGGNGGHDHAGHDHGHEHKPEGGTPFVRRKMDGVQSIIPVVSGKGGVGKSTVAVNLAYTLARLGNKTGLLDLDIFGPSVHKMLNATTPLAVAGNQIIPHEKDGLKIISIGMAIDDEEALVIRGPMVMKLVNQLLNQVNWGELDYLVVDMPPGTGDIPLSLVQQLDVTGAVVVTTPQDISLIDVRRAVSMFKQTQTPILGVVENMSHYVCQKCGDVAHIFGKGGGETEAARLGLPLIAQIPLVKSICDEADLGNPIFDRDKNPALAKVFEDLANRVKALVAEQEKVGATKA